MTIAFYTNFINHHQAYVADELYRLTGGNYTLVEMCQIYDWLLNSGYADLSSRPYVLQAWKSKENYQKAVELAQSADVVMFGCPETLEMGVLHAKTGKITFNVGERWLKRGVINLASPNLLKWLWKYITVLSHNNVYALCASAYGSVDYHMMHCFKDKCFKWGYFTQVADMYSHVAGGGKCLINSEKGPVIKLMWCARFLKWKHPELPVKLATRLKEKGYCFTLDMYGTGSELENIKKLAGDLNVLDVVNIKGNVPNEHILEEMRKHDIFLFTSDRNEGWGAVANEAMSNGCVIVGADEIGSVPYLVKDGENGCIFKSCELDSLCEKVEWLINTPSERERLSRNGFETLRDDWAPKVAARNLVQLIEDLQNGRETSLHSGPCSKAEPRISF